MADTKNMKLFGCFSLRPLLGWPSCYPADLRTWGSIFIFGMSLRAWRRDFRNWIAGRRSKCWYCGTGFGLRERAYDVHIQGCAVHGDCQIDPVDGGHRVPPRISEQLATAKAGALTIDEARLEHRNIQE